MELTEEQQKMKWGDPNAQWNEMPIETKITITELVLYCMGQTIIASADFKIREWPDETLQFINFLRGKDMAVLGEKDKQKLVRLWEILRDESDLRN